MGYMYRYNYAVQKCMAMIKSGELGEIYQIGAEMSTYHSAQYRKWLKNFSGGSMYNFWLASGGYNCKYSRRTGKSVPVYKANRF